MTNEQLLAQIDKRFDDVDMELGKLRAEMRQSFENQGKQIDALSVALGGIDTRLTHVETALTRVASKVGVPGVPALGGSGLPVAAKPPE